MMIPVVPGETVLGLPVHGQKGWMAVHHPSKVDAVPDPTGQAANFGIAMEILLGGDYPRQEQGRVYRRDFGSPSASAGRGIYEVIEPAMLVQRLLAVKAKGGQYPLTCLRTLNPTPFGGDAQAGQTEAGRGTRCGGPLVGCIFIRQGAVANEAGYSGGQFPTEQE